MTVTLRHLNIFVALCTLGLLLPTPAGSQIYVVSCTIPDTSCTKATEGATCPPDGGTCTLPPGVYTCNSSGSRGHYSYCIFNDAVGKRLSLIYTQDPNCTPVEFTGGEPRLQWDPLLGMFAIHQCLFFTSNDVVYGPYLVQ